MKRKYCIHTMMVPIAAALLTTSASASELSDKLYDFFIDGASVTPGVGFRQAGLKVTRLSDGAEGKIVQRDDEAYFLSYSTRPWYSEKYPNLGLSFIFNISSFNAGRQETGPDVFEDLGTRASGEFIYVAPTIFYQWGEHRYVGRYTRVGLGLGLGMARFNGDVILTSTPDQERISVSSTTTDLKLAPGLLLETRWNHWGLRFTVAGPTLHQDEYDIQVEDMAFNLGYSFVF